MNTIYIILKLLPKKLISHITGKLANYKFPKLLLKTILKIYCKIYKVNTKEMKYPIPCYKTINEFFTRPIKKEYRIINTNKNNIVSPVDGTIISLGKITNNKATQIKGISYNINKLIKNPYWNNYFKNGFFINLYLSPKDYHKIHMPYTGKVIASEYTKGSLYPVNNLGLKNIPNLFTINERLSSFIKSSFGNYAIIKIAALNVGNIKTKFPQEKIKNKKTKTLFSNIKKHIEIEKGNEIAKFTLGSTIVLLFKEKSIKFTNKIHSNNKILYGQKIAKIINF